MKSFKVYGCRVVDTVTKRESVTLVTAGSVAAAKAKAVSDTTVCADTWEVTPFAVPNELDTASFSEKSVTATRLQRLAAHLLDVVLFGSAAVFFAWMSHNDSYQVDEDLSHLSSTSGVWFGLKANLAFYGLWCVSEMLFATSPGKALSSLTIVRADGQYISKRLALLRGVIRPLGAMLLGLGYVAALFKRSTQTWHDGIADCYVVSLSEKQRSIVESASSTKPAIVIGVNHSSRSKGPKKARENHDSRERESNEQRLASLQDWLKEVKRPEN